jgi:rhamnosyltransferase
MSNDSRAVLAVVVTYHPDAGLVARLRAIREQADALVVVDNGSANLAEVRAAAQAADARLIANGANLGIAAALNIGARAMLDEGCAWLATFDQDSAIPPGAVAGLLALAPSLPASEQVAILAMSRRDRATGRDYHRRGDILEDTPTWRRVRTTITSGGLVSRRAFERVGLFDEALFIDGVDHDFCLRCRAAGLLVIEAKEVAMDHAIGAITRKRFLGREGVLTNHSPDRRYYITRNTLALSVRHFATDPAWALRETAHLAVWNASAALFEEDRGAKLAAMAEGAWDFATGRRGPRLRRPRGAGRGGPA